VNLQLIIYCSAVCTRQVRHSGCVASWVCNDVIASHQNSNSAQVAVRPTARDPCATSRSCLFFFFSFFYLKGLDFSITQSPWWAPPFQLSFIHRSVIFTALWLFPMHSLSSLLYFLHFFFLQKKKKKKAKRWHCMLNLSHTFFSIYFSFWLCDLCCLYGIFC
jgi:hypothetical protein